MSPNSRTLAAELCASICLERAGRKRGLGVLAEDVPQLDQGHFLRTIAARADGEVRVALLGGRNGDPPRQPGVEITTDPKRANTWRNDGRAKSGVKTITLVLGPVEKLSSLRTTSALVREADIRQQLIDRMTGLHDSLGRRYFWESLGRLKEDFPMAALLSLGAAVEELAGRSKAELLGDEANAVFLVGLLGDPELLQTNGPGQCGKLIRRNRDLVKRIRHLDAKDKALLQEANTSRAASELVRRIVAFDRDGSAEKLEGLSYSDVHALLTKKPPTKAAEDGGSGEAPTKKERIEGDSLGLELALNGGQGLQAAAKRFRVASQPSEDDEGGTETIRVGKRELIPRIRTGTTQASSLWAILLSDDSWGGFVDATAAHDVIAAIKELGADRVEVSHFSPSTEGGIEPILNLAVSRGLVSATLKEAWSRYRNARSDLLAHADELTDHPLLALGGSNPLLSKAKELLESYNQALDALRQTAEALRKVGSTEPAKRIMAYCLALDLAFVRTSGDFVAVAAPVHPFHLWRWVHLLEVIRENTEELCAIGAESLEPVVDDASGALPAVLLSPYVVGDKVTRAQPFVSSGSLGALPLFSVPTARLAGKGRFRAIGQVAQRLVRLMPHASFGLKVLLVDPPSVVSALEELIELPSTLQDGWPTPLHVAAVRTRAGTDDTDEEEAELLVLLRDLKDAGGTFRMLEDQGSLEKVVTGLNDERWHLAVVFEPGANKELRIGPISPPALSPLFIPRAYQYDQFDDRLDVVVAGTVEGLGTYHEVFCDVLAIPREDFVGRRSGASQNTRDLERLAQAAMWLTIVDQGIEPTLGLRGSMRIDWRGDSGRDVVTFTAHSDTIDDLISDALRVAGLLPSDEAVRRTVHQLLRLSGEAVLGLATSRPGAALADKRTAKGVLGLVAAASWYEATYPDALVVSLDNPTSRKWVMGDAEDQRRGDLLGVRQAPQGIIVEALEVKTHDDELAGVAERPGKIEGKAVGQVDRTIQVLRRVIVPEPVSAVDQARRELVRDELYRAVAARQYTPDERLRLVQVLEELFKAGPAKVRGLVIRVRLEPSGERIMPAAPALQRSPAGNEVGLVDIVETGRAKAGPAATDVRGSAPVGGREGSQKGQGAATAPSPARGRADLAPKESVEEPSPQKGEVKVLIGKTGANEEVYWEPGRVGSQLNNFGFLVTGDPGSGKTQVLRAIIAEVCKVGLPTAVFDFKNDYIEKGFASRVGLEVFDVDRNGLPFNPLVLVPDHKGEAQAIRQIHELCGILKRIFALGDQQEAKLRAAMRDAYEAKGIRADQRVLVADLPAYPSFAEVVARLQADPKGEAVVNRLSPLFDLNLFPAGDKAQVRFEELLSRRVVFDLHTLPNNDIKAALAEFIIVRLHTYVLKGEQPRSLRRLLVFDEAWRVAASVRLQELAREGRAFGVGIAIGTQFPGDLPVELVGNLSTQLLLGNSDTEHRKAVARTLCGAASGPTAQQIIQQMGALAKHEGFFRNQHYAPYVLVKTIPHYMR